MGRNNLKTSSRPLGQSLIAAFAIGVAGHLSLGLAQSSPRGGQRGGGPPDGGRGSFDFFKDMPFLSALDADGNGELSPEELENATVALKALDRNGDGKLTLEEVRPSGGPRNLNRGPQGRGSGGRPQGQANNRRPGGASRGDGAPSSGRPTRRQGNGPLPGSGPVPKSSQDERVERILALDTDGNGTLDQNEVDQALIAEADTNGDGKVSERELRAAVAKESESQ